MKKLGLFLTVIFIISVAVFTFGRTRQIQTGNNFNYNSDPQFKVEIEGSDKDGFNLIVSYDEETARNCKVTVSVTMSDDSTKSFTYSNPVRKTSRASFGGEAGLKPAPIKKAEVTSSSCD